MKNLRSLPAVAKHSVLPSLSHTQLQHLFNSLAVIVCAIDAKGYITYVSKACADIWGYQPEELMGTRHIDLVLGEDHEKMQDYTARLKAGQLIPFFENRYYRKDGSIVPMSWAGR